MKTVTNWLIVFAANVIAQFVFWGLISLAGYDWSWKLYWCAFAVYVVISIGDAIRYGAAKASEAN